MSFEAKYLTTVGIVCVAGAVGAAFAASAPGPQLEPMPRVKPTMLQRVAPHHSVTPKQCAGGTYWSDVQAYRADGRAMLSQRWDRDHDRTWWRYPGTQTRVVFDGLTFHNWTRHGVLVAGWCE